MKASIFLILFFLFGDSAEYLWVGSERLRQADALLSDLINGS